jgi:hypothetical protein
MTQVVPTRTVLIGIAVAGAALVFVLPWYVPTSYGLVLSDSAMLGFANWAAVLSLLATAVALGLVARRWAAAPLDGPLWLTESRPPRRRAVITTAVLAAVALSTTAVLAWATRGVPYGEASYFLDRAAQVAAGQRPLLDFGYSYSLAALYLPVWLSTLFRGWGLDPLSAYLIVYVCLIGLSYWMLYLIVSRLALSDSRRAWLLAGIGIPTVLNIMLGVQYLPVRYLAPAVALLAVHAWFLRRDRSVATGALGALIAICGLALTVILGSSEMGIAVAFGTLAYFLALGRRDRLTAVAAAAVYLGCLAPIAVLGRGAFFLVGSFGTGAANVPVLPGPPALLYLLSVFIVAILLPRVLRGSSAAESPFTLSLVVLALVLVPAAFGRADAGHLYYNGLVLMILAAAFLARLVPRAFIPYLVAIVLVFFVSAYVAAGRSGPTQVLRAAASSTSLSDRQFGILRGVLGGAGSRTRAEYAWPSSDGDIAALGTTGTIAMPFGLYAPDRLLPFTLARLGRLDADPVPGLGFTLDDLQAKLRSLADTSVLLVPLEFAPAVSAAQPGSTPKTVWVLPRGTARSYPDTALFPLGFYERYPQPNVSGLMLAYIKANYVRAGTWGPYAVYRRR